MTSEYGGKLFYVATPYDLALIRMAEVDPPGITYGRLEFAATHEVIASTLEHLWVDLNGDGFGDKNVSRIPAGHYPCRFAMSPSRGYRVVWIDQVPGRSDVQIHKGNLKKDSLGCVLVGDAIGHLGGEAAVLKSGVAFDRLSQRLAGAPRTFWLTVQDMEGP